MAAIRVLVSEIFSARDSSGRAFHDVHVSLDDGPPELRRIVSPWQDQDEKELDWYLEVYASPSGSPFETARAAKCHGAIRAYADELYQQLFDDHFPGRNDSDVIVDIQAATFHTQFFGLHWEALERSPLRDRVNAVHVRRCFQPCGPVTQLAVPTLVLNILLVTARPKQDDIDYLLVSQRLVAAVVQCDGPRPLVNVEVVRPGTWQALLRQLDTAERRHGRGYYQLVHFDVHGLRIGSGDRRGVYLTFLDKSGTTALFKKAEIVAEKLQEHGVQGVVLNACRSSSNGESDYSSLPACFVQTGIPMVIGMKANISSGAVEGFTSSFYSSFLHHKRPWHAAVSTARSAMAADRKRNARFGRVVETDDWLVPTLYCSHDVAFVPSESPAKSPAWSFAGLRGSLHPAQNLVNHLRSVFYDHGPEAPVLYGRDAIILELENTLLLPFKPELGGLVWRKHIHLHGLAGVGKSALVKYLSWWWKLTHLVDHSIYIDCNSVRPLSTQKLLGQIYKDLHGISPVKPLNVDDLAQDIAQRSILLTLDHLDELSIPLATVSDRERTDLTQFLGAAGGGRSFVFTVSRNTSEPWLSVPRGLIYRVRLPSLTSPAALDMAVRSLKAPSLTREDLEALESLVDQQDHMPAGILSVVASLEANQLNPQELLHVLTSSAPRTLKLWQPQSKVEREIHTALALFAKSVLIKTNVPAAGWEFVLSLAAFRRRIPPDFLAYWFYRRCYQHSDQGLVQSLGLDAVADILTAKNSDVIARYVTPQDAADFARLWKTMIRGLQMIGVTWPEQLAMPGDYVEEYWHLHPLLTMTLQIYVANGDVINERMGQPCVTKINMLALATHYNQRMLDFGDSDSTLAAFSVQRILFELDSILEATDAWLDTWMAKGMQSFVLVKLTQMFNLNRLEKRDYRLVLNTLLHATEFYESMQRALDGVREIGECPLENFCISASQLQNSAFSVEDWPKVREYNRRVISMLVKSPKTVERSHYARASYAQARMVAAFELKSRKAYKKAKASFTENLAQPDGDDSVLSRRIGNAKIRFMNRLGLLQCEMQREDVHIRELELIYATIKQEATEYVNLSRSANFRHGWTEDDQVLLKSIDITGEELQLRRQTEDISPAEIVDVFTDLLKRSVIGAHDRQSSMVTLYTVLSSGKAFQNRETYVASVLDAYEAAVRNNADTITLANLLIEITLLHVSISDWNAAMESHGQWGRLMRHQHANLDIQTLSYENCVYAICYEGLGQRGTARTHVVRALEQATNTSADKLRLGCLQMHAFMEADDGEYRRALALVCEAGLLAYDRTKDANYESHGILLKFGWRIFMKACAGSQNDEAVLEAHLSNLAKQARGQLPPGPLSTSTVWEHRERPSELAKYFMGLIGIRRGANLMQAFTTGAIYDETSNVRWEYLEDLCFQCFEDESSVALPGPVPTTRREAQPPEAITEALQTLATTMVQLAAITRDERKRSIFWHLCGGTKPVDGNIPPSMMKLFDNPAETDSDGHLEVIRALADEVSIETFDDRGTTVLMHVLDRGAMNAATLLVALGADINATDFLDDGPLHHAVRAQDLTRVELCLRLGSRLEEKNARGLSALAVAVQQDNYEICHQLILHGSNVLARDNIGQTCMMLAAAARQYSNFALCVGTLKPFERDLCRRVLLDYGHGQQNYMDIVLNNIADLDDDKLEFIDDSFHLPRDLEVPDRAGVTAYHRAILNPECSIAFIEALFVNNKANVDLRDDTLFGMTPLHLVFARKEPMADLQVLMPPDRTSGDADLRTLHGNLSPIALVAMGGLTMTLGGQEFSLPRRHRYQLRVASAWRRSCNMQLYNNLSPKALEQLVDLRRGLAFEDEVAHRLQQTGMDQYPLQAAMFEMGFEQAKVHDALIYRNAASGKIVSRMAAKVKTVEEQLTTRNVQDGDSDALIQMRFEVAWKHNSRLLPQVYHMDRHGRCRYVQAASDREDQAHRVWVIDGEGNGRGVLGACA